MSKAVENRESIIIFKLTGVQILHFPPKIAKMNTNAVYCIHIHNRPAVERLAGFVIWRLTELIP